MKSYLLMAFTCLMAINAWSQEQLTGKVVDQNNKALIGATVSVGNKGITTTNNKGEFTIACPGNVKITVSYVGYTMDSKTIDNCATPLTFNLSANSHNLNEIEVTASTAKSKDMLEQAQSVVKLEESELKQATGLYLEDALNTNVPGIIMQRRTNSGGQQLSIRGYGNGVGFKGANNNFDTRGTKVYLNGIPLTDAEGGTVLDDIDFSSVDKVEVSKGPSGTLYGLAIAGVVNLQTQKAEKNKTSVGQDVMVGSYGLLRTTTAIAIGGEKSSLLVNYGHQEFSGFMNHTQAHKNFVNVIGDLSLSDKQKVSAYVGFSDSYDQRNGELTAQQYADRDYSGNSSYIKNDAHSAVRTVRTGFAHQYAFNKHVSNNTTFFGSAQAINNSSAGGWNDKAPVSFGLRSTVDLNFDVNDNIKLIGIVGTELQSTSALANGYRMGADSTNLEGYNIITQLKSVQAISSSNSNFFTQWTVELPKDISVTAGIGLSNMTVRLEDRLWGLSNNTPNSTTPQAYQKSYKGLVSPSFSINKKVSEVASVYASYSVGYKAPVSSNFYIPTTGQVNQGLAPEQGNQIEIGTKGSMLNNRLYYTLAWFSAQFTNKLTTIAVQNPENTATLYSYLVNGGTLDNKGFEILVKYDAIKSKDGFVTALKPFANATISNFHYRDFQYNTIGKDATNQDSLLVNDYSGNQVAGVPPLVFNLGADIETKIGVYANVTYNFRDAMYYTSDLQNQTDAYSLVNAKLGFRKSVKNFDFNLYAGARNITGTQYYNMVFVNQLPDAYIPAANEINFFGGLNVKYNF